MGKKAESFDNLHARSRYFRVQLYPDNQLHADIFSRIKSDCIADSYVGITHKAIEGEKEHMHIVLLFDNPRQTDSLCRSLGFVNDLGEPDDQFCRAIVKKQKRPVDQQLKSCCIYLTHRNAPEKEQYPIEDLFGTEKQVRQTVKWVVKHEAGEVDMPDSVLAILDWIAMQDNIIKAYSFGKWLANSPYWKANNNRIVWAAIREHNLRIYGDQNPVPDHFDTVGSSERYDFIEISDSELAQMGFVWGD